jgi:nucleoside-diphosphate-sugar epimerase
MPEHVLIAGASGLVGHAAMRHFASRGDLRVTAVSRRRPLDTHGADFFSVDLDDEHACDERFGQMRDVTRLVFAALYEKPGLVGGWTQADQIETNRRMLANLFEPLEASARGLRHVTLLQGTKAYGVHVRPLQVPAREGRSEHRDHPNFYWAQEDYLRAKQRGGRFRMTILRPQIIFGSSIGAAMNLIPAIGTYAALRAADGLPLAFPGGASPVLEAVDADLLARAIDWAGCAEAAANETFNVTNGDVFDWRNVWPAISAALGMPVGPDEPQQLGTTMPERADEWDAIRQRHALAAPGLAEFVGESFHYADFCMAYGAPSTPPPALVSTIKLRQAGFTEVMDTEAMFAKWFRRFQQQHLLPAPPHAAC